MLTPDVLWGWGSWMQEQKCRPSGKSSGRTLCVRWDGCWHEESFRSHLVSLSSLLSPHSVAVFPSSWSHLEKTPKQDLTVFYVRHQHFTSIHFCDGDNFTVSKSQIQVSLLISQSERVIMIGSQVWKGAAITPKVPSVDRFWISVSMLVGKPHDCFLTNTLSSIHCYYSRTQLQLCAH